MSIRYPSLPGCLLAFCLGVAAPFATASVADDHPQARAFFPEADRFGALEGKPPAAAVYRGEELLGYVFLTNDVLRIPAYSGKPINTLVGFDVTGRIRGLAIVHHEEPILAVGISEERLAQFTAQYRGLNVFDQVSVGARRAGYVKVDAITGATITVMVQNATVMRAARQVAESRGLQPPAQPLAAEAADTQQAATASVAERPAREQPAAPRAAPAPRRAAEAPPSAPPASSSATPAAEEPLWVAVWGERKFKIAVLGIGLIVLAFILIFQDWFARRPALLTHVRRGYLLYTLFFIGWYALAQLSVVNVLTFMHAVFHDFRWENFLIDPMLFILWSFVALTLLLWGRGVYCGWLCPYGALQELVQQAAQRFNVRQFEFPDVVHERLWAVKYIILIVLFGISLQSLGTAVVYAEVEPFKTAITMRFQREWPFVLYAVGFIVVSAFNRKFFCKYLCPLGAALAIPGRFRIFDWWLRRRKECGKPCQVCAAQCEVRAIRPTGEINHNECHYCLDCQVTYYSELKCPPLAERRKRRERALRAREPVPGVEPASVLPGLDDNPCSGCSKAP